ncbi:MAG: 1-acyl-sn-glycerol-3-phosphate acyltransferase [Deltaproteobacteria bacterium]|nr:1-acyl-sn-glycerol-3-phosphate acyltransferase [Deltaproteobacteria bacterium]
MSDVNEEILYPYVLDYKPKLFFNWILYQLFKRVDIDNSMKNSLKEMQRKGTVVYASKYKGLLDYILYHDVYRRKRLPYPKITFDLNLSLALPFSRLIRVLLSQTSCFVKYGKIPSPYTTGFYKKAIQQKKVALISLIDPKSFIKSFIYARKDHLQFLIETQKDMEMPIFIVPQLTLLQKDPEKEDKSLSSMIFGYRDHMSVFRKIALFFRNYCRAYIDFGKPLNLKEYLENQPPSRPIEDMASELRQMLIERIDNQKRIILGPIMKSRQQLKEMVLTDKKVVEQIERMAAGEPKKLKELRKKAGEYFEEIAADFSMLYIGFFRKALKWFWNKLYEGIEVDPAGSAKVREWARKGPLIYIPSHKSHIDYLVLNNALFDHHMHLPRIAAGQNLAFWPMGHIFRKCGAFFIRRSFKGAKLYSEVFSRYIKILLQEGHPIEFYIEGGRSRNGKLVFPKTGFLSILLQAYKEGFCRDLIFVPTSIIYDRIMEEKAYLNELNGGTKEKENIKQVIKAGRFLKKRYGKIYIGFNEPFSLREYLSGTGKIERNVPRDLALYMVKAINEVSVVTPLSLVSTAILTAHRRGFNISWLMETIGIYMDFLKREKAPIANSLNDPDSAVQDTISLLMNLKIVNFMEDAPGDEEIFYYVEDERKMELEYYKNNIIHFFIHHSFVATSFLTGKDEAKEKSSVIADYMFLKYCMENEFVFYDDKDVDEKIHLIIEYFQGLGYLSYASLDKGYKLTKLGFEKFPMWAAFARTFIESYWIAAQVICNQKQNPLKGANLLKSITYMGKRFHKMGIVDHVGALSQINFQNAVNCINKKALSCDSRTFPSDTSSPFENLSYFTSRLYDFSHFSPHR